MKKNFHTSSKTTCKGCSKTINPEFYLIRGNFCSSCSGGSITASYNDGRVQHSARELKKKSTGISPELIKKYPHLTS